MVTCGSLFGALKRNGLDFYTGVPCSILRDFIHFIAANENKITGHVIASGEGEACAIAAGYHLATGRIPVIYMQNSGEGNCVNPLTSLLDRDVYSIPALLLISWRGEPGTNDEPEHTRMGKITHRLLDTLGIPYSELPQTGEEMEKTISDARGYIEDNNIPYALIVKRGVIGKYAGRAAGDAVMGIDGIEGKTGYPMTREEAMGIIVDYLDNSTNNPAAIISTTGETSRELFELTAGKGGDHKSNFYTIGSMGCAAGIALGVAMQKPKKRVFIFDGDGALLMKMGTLATIGHYEPGNLYHIVFDNGAYNSTGGQPTVSGTVHFDRIALGCDYKKTWFVSKREELADAIDDMKSGKGPVMLVVKVNRDVRGDLGRPTTTPVENKEGFMDFLKNK